MREAREGECAHVCAMCRAQILWCCNIWVYYYAVPSVNMCVPVYWRGVLLGYLLYCWCTLVSMWVLYGWLHVVCTVHCVIMPHYDRRHSVGVQRIFCLRVISRHNVQQHIVGPCPARRSL